MNLAPVADYVAFDAGRYTRQEVLSDDEQVVLSNHFYRSDWPYLQSIMPGLINPLIDLVVYSGVSDRLAAPSVATILWQISKIGSPYWAWSDMQWLDLLNTRAGSRPYLAAVAYQLGGFHTPQRIAKFRQSAIYASFISGHSIFESEHARLSKVLKSLGYEARHLKQFLSSVLGALMLENGDPRLETFTEALLLKGQAHRSEGVARSVGKVSHGLAALGILEKPLRMRSYVSWCTKSIEGIDPAGSIGVVDGETPQPCVPVLGKATTVLS
nr:hypothetical protein [Pseudomonas sp. ADAK13]